jgi:hypothetical protein
MSILFIKSMGLKIVKALVDPIMKFVTIVFGLLKYIIRKLCAPCCARKKSSGRGGTARGANAILALDANRPWYVVENAAEDYEGALDNYNEMAIMYGYIVLFASAFPLAPLLSVITTFFECRLDASDLLKSKRPRPITVNSIGIWQSVFEGTVRYALYDALCTVLTGSPCSKC